MLRKHTNENWALKGHSKVTPKALEHSGTQGSLALEYSSTWGSQAFEGHLSTQALGQ